MKVRSKADIVNKKVLLLGSGELGQEFVIALQRLGQTVIAVDNYADAPAMQVADGFDVIGTTSSMVLDATISNVAGTGIDVNQLSDGILSSAVSNATTPYREYPGWYDISNKTISG